MMKIYKFAPIFKSTIWGGQRIAPFKGMETELLNIGESWEISAVKGNESVVNMGSDAGTTLPQLIDKYKGDIVGRQVYERYGNAFPLLIKFIDASLDLSIQVHPDDELARRRHNSLGKTEMWYVIDAAPGATLLSGMKDKMTKEEYVASVSDNTIADYLCRYEVRKGDCFFLPAGRIHSIGAGSFVAEIQETSDVTYRIYDFNRRDAEGNLRQLHTDLATDAIDFSVEGNYRTEYEAKENGATELVKCSHFTTSLYWLTEKIDINVADIDSFVIAIVCKGSVRIKADDDTQICHYGETVLIATNTSNITLEALADDVKVLLTHV